ncbi:hypothetical protein HBB16_05555 [Pseudonocardia sp. MCCB 268]|nr:hypothetical protein [Pseudonocardia cytotoxica]
MTGTVLGAVAGWAGRVVGQLFQRVIDVLVAIPCGPGHRSRRRRGGGRRTRDCGRCWWRSSSRAGLSVRPPTYQPSCGAVPDYVEGWSRSAPGWGASRSGIVLPNLTRPLLAHPACGERPAHRGRAVVPRLGPQPPTPEWGAMLAEGRQYLFNAPQSVVPASPSGRPCW